jgi:hypothetical protein
MAGYKLGADLRSDWMATVEAGVEAAQPPLLDLGPAIGLLENLPTMEAFRDYADDRLDIAAPTAIIGGDGLLWLMALFSGAPMSSGPSPAMTVLYGGPDLATQVASLGALAPRLTYRDKQELPEAWATLLAPSAQAGAPPWAAFPLAVATTAATNAENDVDDPWLTWAGLLLALLLIILALAF